MKKIRCWDKQQKKYLTLEEYQALGGIIVGKDGTLTLSPGYRFADNITVCTDTFIPEYSTEVLDCYETEVFEGDIVQDIAAGEDYGIIEFEDGHFYIHTPGVLEDIENMYGFQVVGNIHYDSWKDVVKFITEY